MAYKLYNEQNVQDIANAIRDKTGSTDTLKISEMVSAIQSIIVEDTPTSASEFIFDGEKVTKYVGNRKKITIPRSYSKETVIETLDGAWCEPRCLEDFRHMLWEPFNITFKYEDKTRSFNSEESLWDLSREFPDGAYLTTCVVENIMQFEFIYRLGDRYWRDTGIYINGTHFTDMREAFMYIMDNEITEVNFGGDVEITHFKDGDDYQVTIVGSGNEAILDNPVYSVTMFDNIVRINDRAFERTSIAECLIPDSVIALGDYAFAYTNLQITLPDSIIQLGRACFEGALMPWRLPNLLTELPDYCFFNARTNGNNALQIPDGITRFGDYCFAGVKQLQFYWLTSESQLTSLGRGCFQDSGLWRIDFPNVTVFPEECFQNTPAVEVVLPANLTEIGANCFSGAGIGDNIDLSGYANLTLYYNSFVSSKITRFTLPQNLTEIPARCFADCHYIKEVVLPARIRKLDLNCLQATTSVAVYDLTALDTVPEMEYWSSSTGDIETAFTDCNPAYTITVKDTLLEDFKTAPGWSEIADHIVGVAVVTDLTFTAEQENSTVGYNIHGTVDTSGISYKLNDGEWTSWTDGRSITLVNIGDKIQVKNSNNTLSSEDGDNCLQFTMTGLIAAMGDVDSMINYAALTEFCYFSMFKDCTALVTVPMLKSTTLADFCYNSMFRGCTGLTTLPSNFLPATTLADLCYAQMFYGCTGLTTLPSNLLPATTLAYYCYYQMFYACSNLINIPSLPATTLADSCYQNMFSDCSSLTTLPSNLLPATTLAGNCYREMFSGCSSLTAVPSLPATTLVYYCYRDMFSGCSKIKLSTTQSATYPNAYRIPYGEAEGTSASGALTNMFGSTGGTFTGDPEINTIYYTSNEVK